MSVRNGREIVLRPSGAIALFEADPGAVEVIPPADVIENDDAFVIILEIPGAVKDKIFLAVEGDRLLLKAPMPKPLPGAVNFLLRESPPKVYVRAFKLGDGIDRKKITAKFEDGVLTVTLTKLDEAKPKTITIQ